MGKDDLLQVHSGSLVGPGQGGRGRGGRALAAGRQTDRREEIVQWRGQASPPMGRRGPWRGGEGREGDGGDAPGVGPGWAPADTVKMSRWLELLVVAALVAAAAADTPANCTFEDVVGKWTLWLGPRGVKPGTNCADHPCKYR